MYSNRRSGRQRRGPDLWQLMLLWSLWERVQELPYKPPVTLAVAAANVLVHFRELLPVELARLLPTVAQGCLVPFNIVFYGEWPRLFWSAFLHLDDVHLYWNMTSLLLKGAQLERRMGSAGFAGLLAELLLLSHAIMAWGSTWLAETFVEQRALGVTCAAGFSAVLFALKYVLTFDAPGMQSVLGVPLPAKYIAWAELLAIHVLVPGSSFAGHLAGILAGVLHVHLVVPALGRLRRALAWLNSPLRQWNGARANSRTAAAAAPPRRTAGPTGPPRSNSARAFGGGGVADDSTSDGSPSPEAPAVRAAEARAQRAASRGVPAAAPRPSSTAAGSAFRQQQEQQQQATGGEGRGTDSKGAPGQPADGVSARTRAALAAERRAAAATNGRGR